jgi:Right handed beta helix region
MRQQRVRRLAGAAALGAFVALVLVAGAGAGRAAVALPCSGWASPDGSDANPGTRNRPYRTVQRLATSLRPGQAGCLVPGTVFPEHVVVEAAGARRAPIVIRSGPGRRAVLSAGLETTQSTRYVRIQDVVVRPRVGTPSQDATVVLRGFEVSLVRSDIGGDDLDLPRSCVLVDHAGHPVIERNVIHDCGRFDGNELYAAGIRVGIAVNARISDNNIFGNPGDAVALAPNAQRSFVARNLIVDNGSGVYFGGSAAFASRDNRVMRNVIVFSRRYAVHGSYTKDNPVGTGNTVFENCLWRVALVSGVGFREARSRIADPHVVWTGLRYRLPLRSPCRTYVPAA